MRVLGNSNFHFDFDLFQLNGQDPRRFRFPQDPRFLGLLGLFRAPPLLLLLSLFRLLFRFLFLLEAEPPFVKVLLEHFFECFLLKPGLLLLGEHEPGGGVLLRHLEAEEERPAGRGDSIDGGVVRLHGPNAYQRLAVHGHEALPHHGVTAPRIVRRNFRQLAFAVVHQCNAEFGGVEDELVGLGRSHERGDPPRSSQRARLVVAGSLVKQVALVVVEGGSERLQHRLHGRSGALWLEARRFRDLFGGLTLKERFRLEVLLRRVDLDQLDLQAAPPGPGNLHELVRLELGDGADGPGPHPARDVEPERPPAGEGDLHPVALLGLGRDLEAGGPRGLEGVLEHAAAGDLGLLVLLDLGFVHLRRAPFREHNVQHLEGLLEGEALEPKVQLPPDHVEAHGENDAHEDVHQKIGHPAFVVDEEDDESEYLH
mmetsp:Transcript_4885/g.11504  ORF Transcript_4885/g.11504 Transcript_4885/m.11504 type:complete len:427 (+) Transcript_4885:449-1729(+)